MLKKYLIILVIAVMLNLSADVFHVSEQNESYLILDFELPDYQLEQVEINDQIYQRIYAEESNHLLEPGLPQLPFYSGILGIPLNGEISCKILQKKSVQLENVKIFPAHKIIYQDDQPVYEFFEIDPDKSHLAVYPVSLISDGEKMYYKNRHLNSFKFFPFQYDFNSEEISIITSAKIRIDISGNKQRTGNFGPSHTNSFIDNDIILNNEISSRWLLPKPELETFPQRNGDIIEKIQLIVDEEGLYKIDYDQLLSSLELYDDENEIELQYAMNWDELDPRYLELSDEFGPVPIHFSGENDGSFDQGDFFEFFGNIHYGDEGYYDDYTSENVYVLEMKDNYGSRMAVENGGLETSDPDQYTVPSSFRQTIHLEEQNFIDHLGAQFDFNSILYYREDIWFWEKISSPHLRVIPFELQYPEETTIRTFDASISVFGSTFNPGNYYQNNHLASININSALINNLSWGGQTEVMFENESPLPNSFLYHGENLLYINLPGLPGIAYDKILLDYLDLTYWREYKTTEDKIKFTKPHNKPFGLYQFQLENFNNSDISVYKLGSSIMENVQITGNVENSFFTATFQDDIEADDLEYYAVTEAEKNFPLSIKPDIPSNLKDPYNSADYVIITVKDFTEAEGTLLYQQLWEEEGHIVKIIDIQNIYDEFNFGIRSAEAVKDFLTYCYNFWSAPELTHVMLLGDGIMDERDNSSNREFNIIPFRRIWVEQRGAIASDNWFGCIIGDDPVADISIGRVNVWQAEQILDVAEKTQTYLENPNYEDLWHSRLILSAGGNPSEGTFFAQQSERVRDLWIPDRFNVCRIYCNTEDMPDEYHGNTTSLISEINDGVLYLQFMGHGGGFVWADYNLLNKADITTFNNENYPFVSSLSCYGSAFNYPQNCIGEELILTPGKGAIGHVGFTGYGYKYADEDFANYLTEAIFYRKIKTQGEIVDYTKMKFFAAFGMGGIGIALTQGCALLGDPMVSLLVPDERIPITLNNYNMEPGDTLVMRAEVDPSIIGGKFIIYNENDAQLPLNEYYPFQLPALDGIITASDYIVTENPDSIATRYIKFSGYSEDKEITGYSNFTVGTSAIVDIQISPEQPSENDSIMISARFFDEDGIDHIECVLGGTYELPMVHAEDNRYELQQKVGPFETGDVIIYSFRIFDSAGDSLNSQLYNFHISGPDLNIQNSELVSLNGRPALKTQISNIGNLSSLTCDLKVYDIIADNQLITEIVVDPLEVDEIEWIYVPLPLLNGQYIFRLIVNESENYFTELYNNNITTSELFEINMFEVGEQDTTIYSLDQNFSCWIPAGMFPPNTVFYINSLTYSEPLNQPDIETVPLLDGSESDSYSIGVLNEALLADSLGHFLNSGSIGMTFYLTAGDSLSFDNIRIYREEPSYVKWLLVSGENEVENSITYNTDRTGNFTVLRNNDIQSPLIDANVEGQEFTYGGYISAEGTISFILSDANGIDVFSDNIILWLDGTPIYSGEFVVSSSPGHLSSVPVKYQLQLPAGDHNLTIECSDVNGNYNYRDISFKVNDEFDIINVANYPNPVKSITSDPVNAGRTRFTYVLTDDADKVYLKIYTVSGRLVNTFRNMPASVGYHEYPRTYYGWDCTDKEGFELANGVYFFTITAIKGKEKIEKTHKMAILK
jgi:peptidase C25-like protein/flagellar hook capping protein FlgD